MHGFAARIILGSYAGRLNIKKKESKEFLSFGGIAWIGTKQRKRDIYRLKLLSC